MASAAIAAAAKKRAEKLGIRNEEVDETNVGKGPVGLIDCLLLSCSLASSC